MHTSILFFLILGACVGGNFAEVIFAEDFDNCTALNRWYSNDRNWNCGMADAGCAEGSCLYISSSSNISRSYFRTGDFTWIFTRNYTNITISMDVYWSLPVDQAGANFGFTDLYYGSTLSDNGWETIGGTNVSDTWYNYRPTGANPTSSKVAALTWSDNTDKIGRGWSGDGASASTGWQHMTIAWQEDLVNHPRECKRFRWALGTALKKKVAWSFAVDNLVITGDPLPPPSSTSDPTSDSTSDSTTSDSTTSDSTSGSTSDSTTSSSTSSSLTSMTSSTSKNGNITLSSAITSSSRQTASSTLTQDESGSSMLMVSMLGMVAMMTL